MKSIISTPCNKTVAVTKNKAADLGSTLWYTAEWEYASGRIICLSRVYKNSIQGVCVDKCIRKVCKDVPQCDNLSRNDEEIRIGSNDPKKNLSLIWKVFFFPTWKHSFIIYIINDFFFFWQRKTEIGFYSFNYLSTLPCARHKTWWKT